MKIEVRVEEEILMNSISEIRKQAPETCAQDICSLLIKYAVAIAFSHADSKMESVSFLTGLFNEFIQEAIKGD